MVNRKLKDNELPQIRALLDEVRSKLIDLSNDDDELLFAYRRKLAKELVYDERSKPAFRKALKKRMRTIQMEGALAAQKNYLKPMPSWIVLKRTRATSKKMFDSSAQNAIYEFRPSGASHSCLVDQNCET
jgi:hypothetical protein